MLLTLDSAHCANSLRDYAVPGTLCHLLVFICHGCDAQCFAYVL
jgi:hypothetical protein